MQFVKKLTLNKETILTLNHEKLDDVQGGLGWSNHNSCQNYGCIIKDSLVCPTWD